MVVILLSLAAVTLAVSTYRYTVRVSNRTEVASCPIKQNSDRFFWLNEFDNNSKHKEQLGEISQ